MEINDFVRDHIFHHIPAKYDDHGELVHDEVWWREVKEDGEGYLLVWADGEHHHTYHYPPNIWA